MKRKLLLVGIILLSVFMITGCKGKEEGEVDYNAVYEGNGVTIKTYKKDNTIYYNIASKNIETSGSSELENNKINLDITDKSTLEFIKGNIKIETDNEFLKNGNYKKTGTYTDDEFYLDHYGKEEYSTSELNGVYTKSDFKVYVYQRDEKVIRILYKVDGMETDLELEENDKGEYTLEFFEDNYTITMSEDSMTIKIETDNDELKSINGTYKKDSNLEKKDIMDIYMPY